MAWRDRRPQGQHLRVEGGQLLFPPVQQPYPPLYFGGSSDAGIEIAAEQVDIYLTWGEPPGDVAHKIEQARAAAAARGRELRFGIRLHVIVRETAAEAWAEAERLIEHVDEASIAKAQAVFARMDSVGQQRMAACTAAGATSSRSAPTCGPASAWCAAAPARRWSATPRRWRRG